MAKKNAIQDFSGEIGIASLVVAVVALMCCRCRPC